MKLLTAEHGRRQRLQARAFDRRSQGGGERLRLGPRVRRPKPRGTGDILTGRGIAYTFRGQTIVAEIAEVEVNRQTGHVWVKRLVCAHDCGLVINPEGAASHRRVRHAAFGRAARCTRKCSSIPRRSRAWIGTSHPTLTHADTPAKIDVVLVNGDPNPNRPDLPPYGAGETACKPMIAAIANAIHDATGVRLRRIPFRPARVLAALENSRA